MQLKTFFTLLEPAGQEILGAALDIEPREADFLQHFQSLSKHHPPAIARAALEIAILRRAAEAKFPFAEQMYFTRPALEQASAWEVSTYRAERFRPFERLADLGCSIGGDTLALAQVAPTLAIDSDPLRLMMARANLSALALVSKTIFARADLTQPLPISPHEEALALFFDPGRRAGNRRLHSVRDYQPPLAVVQTWLENTSAVGVKVSPGVKLDELHGYDAEVEFISLNGELKEAALWFGPLKSAARRATILPGSHTLAQTSGFDESQPPPLLSVPRRVLYEPDPAVLRAGLVRDLAVNLDAAQLDPDIAYLTADQHQYTPFARAWIIQDWFPFGMKRLRAYLRGRDIGRVTVKKRGSPLQPEELIRALRLKGERECTLFLTHLRGRPIVIVGDRTEDEGIYKLPGI